MMILVSTILLAILFSVGVVKKFFKFPTNTKKSPLPKKELKGRSSNSATITNMEELEGVFATFDKNKDGFITKQELKDSLKNIGIFMEDKEIAEMMEKVDENHDGLIDLNEFYELCNSNFIGNNREDEDGDGEEEEIVLMRKNKKERDLREAFEVFDGDRDGLISAEELSKVLGCLGLKGGKTLEDCEEMIGRFDLDGDGMVNFNEFTRMMSQRVVPIL